MAVPFSNLSSGAALELPVSRGAPPPPTTEGPLYSSQESSFLSALRMKKVAAQARLSLQFKSYRVRLL